MAFLVIWIAGLFGGDSGPSEAQATVTVAGGQQNGGAATSAPAGDATIAATPTAATTSGKFNVGDVLVVTGTGDCLNVRVAPGTSNNAIVCLKDAEEVTVTGGPVAAGDLQWWKVQTKLGEGWAAEDYLVKK